VSLGLAIKMARIQNKLTQKDVAQEIKISSQYLSEIECDKRIPSYLIAKKLQVFFPNSTILKEYEILI